MSDNAIEFDVTEMSASELLKQEAELEAAEEAEPDEQQPEQEKDDAQHDAQAEGVDDDGKPKEPSVEGEEEADEDAAGDEPEKGESQAAEHKDVSPPEKWISRRHKARQAKLDDELTAKNSDLQSQVDALQQQVDLMKARGIDVPDSPLDILSDERIKEVREEHGDSVADMFQAVKAAVSVGKQKSKVKGAVAADSDGAAELDERTQALLQDDHIAYWLQEKPDLYDKAVDAERELALDKDFFRKPYPEQAKAIVEKVKETVLSEKKPKNPIKPDKKGETEPPKTLAGASGAAPATDTKGPADRIIDLLDSGSRDEAIKLYDSLPDGDEKLKVESWMEEQEEEE